LPSKLKDSGFHKRLRDLIASEPPYAWARRVGISKGAFTRIFKQGTIPTAELLYRIHRATDVSFDWLLTGAGVMRQDGLSSAAASAQGMTFIPPASATALAGAADPPWRDLAFSRAWIARELGLDPEGLLLLKVGGDAMAPTLADGDLALADGSQSGITQDGIYALGQGDLLRVRRVQHMTGAEFLAQSDNPLYAPFVFNLRGTVRVVGRIVWVGRRIP
jgi:phage repressor protein C with HTH and peptisase S24 domain